MGITETKILNAKLRKYPEHKPINNQLCVCSTSGFCRDGAVVARYENKCFVMESWGDITQYVTAFMTLPSVFYK